MTDRELLILSVSDIGEKPIVKSKSNHTVHWAAFEAVLLHFLAAERFDYCGGR
jgi:hypothetical protein